MDEARAQLLERVIAEVSANGLADRSLREIAAAVGSSHRMLHYHFGSRAGLVAAVVEAVEGAQRELLVELSREITDPVELSRELWLRTSTPELLPFVRLFFECVGLTGGQGLTDPWLMLGQEIGERIGVAVDMDEFRLGVAVTRGLLIDVLAAGDATEATRSFERFLELWAASRIDAEA
ncbi:MAG TPA: TetR/AcrR family transcriptional regulator [Dehalococcoidia bacterium]|nr:TetR/AcrR family transcriptional regulator [Dehalococcoidia bacterium]